MGRLTARFGAATGGRLPSPRLPAPAQALAFRLAPERYLEACHRRHGDVVAFPRGSNPRYVAVFEPRLAQQVLGDSSARLSAREARAAVAPSVLVGENSVAVLDGTEHVRRRRLLAPAFHGERMRNCVPTIRQAVDRQIDAWPIRRPFPLLPSLATLTLDVIVGVVFGVRDERAREELAASARALLYALPRRGSSRRLVDAIAPRLAVDQHLDAEISRRRATPEREQPGDLLSTLLLARPEDGAAITDRELRDDLVTLLVAGSATTAVALAWTFEELMSHPAALDRLHRDLADGHDGYLNAVVQETLRLHSPASAFMRRTVRDRPYDLGPHSIPPGTEIRVSIAAMHRRAEHWPQPLAFRPDRFLGPEAPNAGMPFGWGVHRCLGASFATLEMKVVIRRVLERTRLAPAGGRRLRAVRAGLMQAPARGIRVVVEHREPASRTM